MRKIKVTNEFRQIFVHLPRLIQREANDIAQQLRSNPLDPSLGVRKLIGVVGNQYRIRIGEYRLIYSFTAKTVLLRIIGHRSDVYRSLKK